MKSLQKEELRSLTLPELNEKLSDLDRERIKLKTNMRPGYPTQAESRPFGNMRRIKKDIARIKTFIHERRK